MYNKTYVKSLFNQMGKFFVILAYWGIFLGVSYLFFDEYRSDHHWTSLCYVVAFISMGCAAHGLFLGWIYNEEIKIIATRHQKAYAVIEKIESILSFFFLGLFILSFLLALIGPLLLSAAIGMLIIIRSTYIYWSVVLCCLVTSLLLRIPRNLLQIRVLAKLLYRVFLCGFIALIVYCEILVFNVLAEEYPNCEDMVISAAVFLLFVLAGISFLLFNSIKKGIFSLSAMRYVLLLRAFKDDNICIAIYSRLKNTIKLPIKLIGNPSEYDTWFNDIDEDNCAEIDKHWLPHTNWKFFLRFYIARSSAVVMLVGSTDGLVWETVENIRRLNKCVICYSSVQELRNFQVKIQTLQNPALQSLINAINIILEQNIDFNAFVVHKDKVYVDNVDVLTKQVLKNNLNAATLTIDLASNVSSTNQPLWNDIKYRVYRHLHILNFINTLESLESIFIRKLITVVATSVVIGFYLAGVAIGVLLVLCPIFIWIMPDYDTYPIGMKIFLPLLSIGFGSNILKEIFSKEK